MSSSAFCTEATLGLRVDTLCQLLQAYEHDAGVEFSDNAQEGDASVVVAVTSVTLLLVQGDNLGISYVLW